jgi:ABC-type branched-subunit amino acid transport system ATPase component
MNGAVLTVSGLHARYGGEDILHDVAIAVPRGAIVAVIGPERLG